VVVKKKLLMGYCLDLRDREEIPKTQGKEKTEEVGLTVNKKILEDFKSTGIYAFLISKRKGGKGKTCGAMALQSERGVSISETEMKGVRETGKICKTRREITGAAPEDVVVSGIFGFRTWSLRGSARDRAARNDR